MTGELPVAGVPAASGHYVQNTTTQQSDANFNISGDGTAAGTLAANLVNATTQYNLGGNRALSNPGTNNLFAGVGAGAANTLGLGNAFFGQNTGAANTSGTANAFFGQGAGAANTTANYNAFFGRNTGAANTTGSNNAFFGYIAGNSNTTGDSNSFFGAGAGFSNTTGNENSYFGRSAGLANTIGFGNAFFGHEAGTANTTGAQNAFFGLLAGQANVDGFGNAFFGAVAGVSNTSGQVNSFFGNGAGLANMTGSFNSFFGHGAGHANTTGSFNVFFGDNAGGTNTTGGNNTIIGTLANVGANNLNYATAHGADAVVSTSNTVVLGRAANTVRVPGTLVISTLAAAAATHLCIDGSNKVANCASSLRYKQNVASFAAGLNLIQRLRPVSFNWKESNLPDLGLIAEEVAALEPLLVTRNQAGEIQGVKYDQLTVVLINALKQQQEQIKQQQAELAQLKQLVCAQQPKAVACQAR